MRHALGRTRAAVALAMLAGGTGSVAVASVSDAQIRASELASVSQTVDGTKLTIEYSRPRTRGRTPIFGTRIVQWDEVWTPGANFATTFQASKDVTLNGTRVPKGTYSVWMVVRKAGDWTFVLDPRARMFHMDHPDSTAQQIRFPVKVTQQQQPSVDVLTWSFPEVRSNGASMVMAWDTFRTAVDVGVAPSLVYATEPAVAAEYVGRFEGKGTTESWIPPEPFSLTVVHDKGILRGDLVPEDKYLAHFALIRVAPDVFTVGVNDEKGEIYEVLRPDMMITFKR
ncbi:MAG: DUF2911 domain-containing protein, partial [Gemmatimonadota bacterium]